MRPETVEKQPDRPIELKDDYGLWEKLYGRNLTDYEKLEIKTNLSTFFGILIDEHKKLCKS